ncbi:hypothetical protein P154DRAFT_521495 [Amniculicola lignicola CBS 123094]|uniref:Uncharacterized protein n=1 Tax=Amniculicola lignicola CBS 123094 TaxID=1392246 RepID=A0A6A5WNI2_9PLEO|nr:hypothetical protein P154DRAFT_521495 [Amniculicola lignicola CBS 123094]
MGEDGAARASETGEPDNILEDESAGTGKTEHGITDSEPLYTGETSPSQMTEEESTLALNTAPAKKKPTRYTPGQKGPKITSTPHHQQPRTAAGTSIGLRNRDTLPSCHCGSHD